MTTFNFHQGQPYPLGSHVDEHGVNFAVYSEHAEHIDLCVLNPFGDETRYPLHQGDNHIWHGYLAGAKTGLHYGYRARGKWVPLIGLRFNHHCLLIDPYSRALTDKQSPYSIVNHEPYDWRDDIRPNTPWSNTVIYEAHVRGLTQLHPDIPSTLRGSYAAIAQPCIIQHLTNLGITALELLPVQFHLDEPHLQARQLTNYWGYNTLAPFAIEPQYWSGLEGSTPLSEFRNMVKTLHRAGIEVILDIVFNHTAELDDSGPCLSFRGLDNPTYYWLNHRGEYLDWTGCGNTLKLDHSAAIQWVLDCLHFWAIECHVDGFRFDLASVLGRTPIFNSHASLLNAITQDPILNQLKLIAEPWDLASDGYQLSQFPSPFAEWNDRFRDDIRRIVLHQDVPIGILASRLAGSRDCFFQPHHSSFVSINYITAHDGFTLRDLVSFNHKHNEANHENNQDGHDHNNSHNHGFEGLNAPEEILVERQQSQQHLLSLLLLSLGTPMLRAGDELGHSQQGNNNAYCQDNPISWINWQEADKNLMAFTTQLIALRQQTPALISGEWWHSLAPNKTVEWLNAQGMPVTLEQWQHSYPLQVLLSGQWLLLINFTEQPHEMTLPQGDWQIVAPFHHHSLSPIPPKTFVVMQRHRFLPSAY
ncbi:TPA: glycogen debranching protein GlgX [Providencia alcalifaciens]